MGRHGAPGLRGRLRDSLHAPAMVARQLYAAPLLPLLKLLLTRYVDRHVRMHAMQSREAGVVCSPASG